jgi:DNA polymerase-3 subunit delta'
MKFSDLIGHKEIAANLKNMVDNDRIPHAILFAEKPGCGALPLVLSLLQYMFCKNKRWVAEQEGGGLFGAETSVGEGDTSTVNESAPDSCGICGGCKKMTDLVHPDVHFVFPINTSQLVEKGKKVSIDMYYGLFRELVKKNPYFSEQDLYRKLGLENKLGIIGVSEATWIINKLSFSAYEGRR